MLYEGSLCCVLSNFNKDDDDDNISDQHADMFEVRQTSAAYTNCNAHNVSNHKRLRGASGC